MPVPSKQANKHSFPQLHLIVRKETLCLKKIWKCACFVGVLIEESEGKEVNILRIHQTLNTCMNTLSFCYCKIGSVSEQVAQLLLLVLLRLISIFNSTDPLFYLFIQDSSIHSVTLSTKKHRFLGLINPPYDQLTNATLKSIGVVISD